MSTEKKSGKISIANVAAVIGFALLLTFSFFGYLIKTSGNFGISLGISLIVVVGCLVLLVLLIKMKRAVNDLKKWKIAEVIVLIAYLIFASVFTFNGGFMHLFSVNENRESLQELGRKDIKAINSIGDKYRTIANKQLEELSIELSTAYVSNQVRKGDGWEDIGSDREVYMEERQQLLLPTEADTLGSSATEELGYPESNSAEADRLIASTDISDEMKYLAETTKAITQSIESWSIIDLPMLGNKLQMLLDDTNRFYNDPTNGMYTLLQKDLPKIWQGNNGFWYIEHGKRNIDRPGTFNYELKLGSALSKGYKISLLGVVVGVIIHLLILLSYFVARRTTIVRPTNYGDDGGIELEL